MTSRIIAASVAVIAATAFASAAMAQGPKLSSGNFIPTTTAPASEYDAAMMGPKASSGAHVATTPPMAVATAQPTPGGAHWVYQQGYDRHGWHQQWVQIP